MTGSCFTRSPQSQSMASWRASSNLGAPLPHLHKVHTHTHRNVFGSPKKWQKRDRKGRTNPDFFVLIPVLSKTFGFGVYLILSFVVFLPAHAAYLHLWAATTDQCRYPCTLLKLLLLLFVSVVYSKIPKCDFSTFLCWNSLFLFSPYLESFLCFGIIFGRFKRAETLS